MATIQEIILSEKNGPYRQQKCRQEGKTVIKVGYNSYRKCSNKRPGAYLIIIIIISFFPTLCNGIFYLAYVVGDLQEKGRLLE